ncbi:hypothetical protein Taro_009913 [Colocasia esculenta]|uniref:Uncharacterized protein n=1 Tax=Colocasia esculenta TaxID=4460 RepID=A0A843U1T7_COLES|nr:hypothetical protein [Colocasia esculenta]
MQAHVMLFPQDHVEVHLLNKVIQMGMTLKGLSAEWTDRDKRSQLETPWKKGNGLDPLLISRRRDPPRYQTGRGWQPGRVLNTAGLAAAFPSRSDPGRPGLRIEPELPVAT